MKFKEDLFGNKKLEYTYIFPQVAWNSNIGCSGVYLAPNSQGVFQKLKDPFNTIQLLDGLKYMMYYVSDNILYPDMKILFHYWEKFNCWRILCPCFLLVHH